MAIQENPDSLAYGSDHKEGFINLGMHYSRMNRLSDAMACYEKALALGEDYMVYFNIGSIHYRRGEYKKAVLDLDRSRRLNGSFLLATLAMGLSFRRLGNFKAAETCFCEVLRGAPRNRAALAGLMAVYWAAGRFEDALRLTDVLLSSEGGRGGIRRLRADMLIRLKRYEESVGELKSMKEEDGSFRRYDECVKEMPPELLADSYGTIEDKIESLKTRVAYDAQASDCIALSLCCLLAGDSDSAVEYLVLAKKQFLN